MRILVVGGTRFIGLEVVKRLNSMGHEIVVFHRGRTEGIPPDGPQEFFHRAKSETTLPDGVQEVLGQKRRLGDFVGAFKQLAPHVVLDMIPLGQEDAQTVMHVFTRIARRVVGISSMDVYRAFGRLRGTEPGPLDRVLLTEESPLRANHYVYRADAMGSDDWRYDYEKILAEQAIMANPALPGTIVRLPAVYGPRDPLHRLFTYLKRMDDGRPAILLDEDLAQWRWSRGYVEDMAAAIALAVTDERAAGRMYHVAEREALQEAEWIRQIGRVAGWSGDVLTVHEDRLPPHLKRTWDASQHVIADSTRIREELRYGELVGRGEALRRTIAWQRAHPPEKIDPAVFDYSAEDRVLDKFHAQRFH